MSELLDIIISAVDEASSIFESVTSSANDMEAQLSSVDSSEMDDVAAGADNAEQEIREADEAVQELDNDLSIINSSMLMQLGEQVGQLGSQAEGMAQDMNTAAISIGQLATNVGMAEPQMVSLINTISNATFPQEEAIAYANALNQMGVSADHLGDSATNMDRINDATGIGYQKVMQLAQGLQSVGISADNLPASFNAIAYAQANVNGGADTLTTVLKRQAATINEYGLNVDQLVIIMQKLSERGVQGMKMGSELSNLLKEANGDTRALEESLGLAAGTLSNASSVTGEYAGQLQALADEEAEHKTLLDQLGAAWEDITLAVSGFLGPFLSVMGLIGQVGSFGLQIRGLSELVSLTRRLTEIEMIDSAVKSAKAVIMSVVTVATTAYAAIVGVLTGEIGLVTAATMVWNAVLAMNPIVWIIAAIAALIVVIYEVGKAFGWWSNVQEMLSAIWDGINRLWRAFINHPDVQAAISMISNALSTLWSWIVQAGQAVLEFFGITSEGNFDIVRAIIDGVGAAWEAMTFPIRAVIGLIEWLIGGFTSMQETITGVWDAIMGVIGPYVNQIVGFIMSLIGVFDQFKAGQMSLPSFIITILGMLWNAYVNVVSQILGLVLRFGSQLLSRAVTAGRNFLNGVMNQVRQLPNRMLSALLSVISAIVSAGSQWVSNAKSKAQEIVSGVSNVLSGTANAVASALSGVVDAIVKPFRDAYNQAKQWWDQITSLGGARGGDSAYGGDLAYGSDLLTGDEISVLHESEPLEVNENINLTLDLKNVPASMDERLLIETLNSKDFIQAFVSNPVFQDTDARVKRNINLRYGRARGV